MKKSKPSFKSARIAKKLTQKAIADSIGVTVQAISSWETGIYSPRLSPAQTAKLCDLLNCSVWELAEMFDPT